MSDTTLLKLLSRHLPLLRAPLLLNNVICLVLSGLCSHSPIYQTQLALISISSLTGSYDLIRYSTRKRASRQDRANVDEDIHDADLTAAADGTLSLALSITWIIGLVAYSSWNGLIGIIAVFGAFIAWSFHSIAFLFQVYAWMRFGRRAIRRCPNCDYDLSGAAALNRVADSGDKDMLKAQAREPGTEEGSLANEYDETETDCLILKDGEENS